MNQQEYVPSREVQDEYYAIFDSWNDECRSKSTTGENLVRESMSKSDYEKLIKLFWEHARANVLRGMRS